MCLILLCIIFLAAVVGVIPSDLVLKVNLGNFEPWNVWFGFRITSMVFFVFSCAVWLIPFPFFCITCLILEALFDDLHKRTSLLHSHTMTVATLRREHHKLCKVVESAGSMLSPLVLEAVAFFIPVICFNFCQAVIAFKRGELTFVVLIVSILFRFLSSTALLAIISGIWIKGKRKGEVKKSRNKQIQSVVILLIQRSQKS